MNNRLQMTASETISPVLADGTDRRNLMGSLEAHALVRPEACALQLGEHRFSHHQLHVAVQHASEFLHRQGIGPGALVALRLADMASLAVGVLALMRMGATAMPLSPTATPEQVRESMGEAQARWLLVEPGVNNMAPCCSVLPFAQADFLIEAAPAPQAVWVEEPDAPCLLITGSGTTGRPRLMAVTHGQMRARVAMQQKRYAVTPRDRVMVVTPLHFSVSIHNLLAGLFAGGSVCVWDQQGSLAEAVAVARPDVLSLTAMHAEALLLAHDRGAVFDLAAVRVVTLTSSTISEALRLRLRHVLRANLHIVYGTNEVYSATVVFPHELDRVALGVGRPDAGVRVEVVDAQDRLMPPNEVGEVRVKSPAQIIGYVNATDVERFRGGWFYPGDLARWDISGQLVLMGRSDDMMIVKGVNIYPGEIEQTLREHPAVSDVAAFALHHAVLKELPVCVVALRTGERRARAELMAFARERLGPKAPRVLAIAPAVARNPQGKPARAALSACVNEALRTDAPPSAERAQAYIRALDEKRQQENRAPCGRQRSQRVGFALELPAWAPWEKLRRWRLVLRGEPGNAALADGPMDVEVSHQAVLWSDELLQVTATLLQAARAPWFDSPWLLSCKPTGEPATELGTRWQVHARVPLLDGFSSHLFGQAWKAALQLEAWVRAHPDLNPDDLAARQAFLTWADKHALVALRKLVPGGKSSIHVLRAAHDMGVPFAHLGAGIYQLGWGAKAHRINRSSSDRDSAIGALVTHRKDLTAKLLCEAGLPGAQHEVVTTLPAARQAAQRIGWPVVVKPADADRGEGVHVDVLPDTLDTAFAEAQRCSPGRRVLVERQIAGTCHRIFVAGGQLLYSVKRLPQGLYGDGEASLVALVSQARARWTATPAWSRSPAPELDALALAALAEQGMTPDCVPKAGQFIALRRFESTAWGGVDEDVTHTIHPHNVRVALEAAALCGLDVAGVDLISTDIAQPWHANGAAINEINFSPLLGGGEISRQHVQTYLNRLMGGNGRIPVEVYVGQGPALSAAQARAKALRKTGLQTALTTHDRTETGEGETSMAGVDGLCTRIRALVRRPGVAALVIVVQNDELLNQPLPLEGVDRVHLVGGADIRCATGSAPERRNLLLRNLKDWAWSHG